MEYETPILTGSPVILKDIYSMYVVMTLNLSQGPVSMEFLKATT